MQQDLTDEINAATASLHQQLRGFPSTAAPSNTHDFSGAVNSLVHPQEVVGLLVPSPDLVRQAAAFVFRSPFIQGNRVYRDRVSNLKFEFLADETTVNAFATDDPIVLPSGVAIEPPLVVVLGGLATAFRLTSTALAAHICSHRLSTRGHGPSLLIQTFHEMGKAIRNMEAHFDLRAAQRIFTNTIAPLLSQGEDRFVSMARSYAAAMDMFVVAHEVGHVALSHTLGERLNYDVSRNQEREADSFASSALSTSPFREYLFLGQVLVTVVFSWVDHGTGQEATTHPLSRERFFSALQSNSEAAKDAADDFGLTEDVLVQLLPDAERH